MARSLPRVPGVGNAAGSRAGQGRRCAGCPRPRSPHRRPGSTRCPRSSSGRDPAGSANSTGCSAAAWCPGRSCCWPVNRESGKSTLLLSAAKAWAAGGQGRVLIVTGEESVPQVRRRADRMGALHPDIFLAAENDLGAVLGHLDQVRPTLVIVDSVQTISTAEVEGSAGGVSQVRAVAAALTAAAKERDIACVLVGHVTKDGAIAGPRVLEHLVDVVLHFEGERHSSLRLIRGVKNRVRAVRRGRLLPDGAGRDRRAGRSVRAVPVRQRCAGAGHLRHRDRAGQAGTSGRGAEPDRAGRRGDQPPDRVRTGLGSHRHGAGGAAAVGRRRTGRAGRAGRDGRRGQDDRAGRRPAAGAGGVVVGAGHPVGSWPGGDGRARAVRRGAADRRCRPSTDRGKPARLRSRRGARPVRSRSGRKGMRVDEVSNLGDAFRSLGNDDGVVQWLRRRSRSNGSRSARSAAVRPRPG